MLRQGLGVPLTEQVSGPCMCVGLTHPAGHHPAGWASLSLTNVVQ